MKLNVLPVSVLILVKWHLVFAAFSNHWHLNRDSFANIGRIVGGHDAKPNSHPYIVSLQLRFLWIRTHFCGGTLIRKNWILTAGHCIKESFLTRWLPIDAVAGAHQVNKLDRSTQITSVAKRIVHPLYDGGVARHDIGLLRTQRPFEWSDEVQPAYLPKSFGIDNDPLELSGWGVLSTTLFIPDLPDNLQEVSVTYIPYEDCFKALDKKREPGEDVPLDKLSHICTGPLTGGIAGCNGDSGGPLIQYVNTRKYYGDSDSGMYIEDQYDESEENIRRSEKHKTNIIPVVIGVVSWGIAPCGEEGAPTVFTNVSNYMHFIREHIGSESD